MSEHRSSLAGSSGFACSFASLVFLVIGASGALADDSLITKMSAGRIERIVKSFTDVKNFKEIGNNTYLFEVDGMKIVIFNQGESLSLSASFTNKPSLSRINEWNRIKRFTRAYLDKDNEAVLDCDLELTGGVSEKNVEEWMKTFVISLTSFRDHIS